MIGGDLGGYRVSAIMNIASLLRHPCGVCGRPVTHGARWCPHCGARGFLMTHGPNYISVRHWLVAIGVIVVPFAAAAWVAHQR